MIKLFNNIYLDDILNHDLNENGVVVTSTPDRWPKKMRSVMSLGGVKIDEEGLKKFWQQLCDMGDRRFIIYADARSASQLLIQYFRSILVNCNDDSLKYLFHSYYYSQKLIWLSLGALNKIKQTEEEYLDDKTFIADCRTNTSVPCLRSLSPGNLSLEILLVNLFFKTDSSVGAELMYRLEQIVWNAFFDSVDILKRDVLNAAFELSKVFPLARVSAKLPSSPFDFISSELSLRWITDEKFVRENRSYVVSNYSAEDFTKLFKDVAHARALNPGNGIYVSSAIEDEDYYRVTRAAFLDSPAQLLEEEVLKSFGFIFFNDSLWRETNHVLVSRIMESRRAGNLSELEFLRLS